MHATAAATSSDHRDCLVNIRLTAKLMTITVTDMNTMILMNMLNS